MIEFAGIRSDERYLIVEHYPKRKIPKRRYTTQVIPGRAGTYVIPESDDAFDNYTEEYSVFLDSKAPGLPMAARGLTEWLMGPVGYQRLEDSYDPDFYRMALYAGGDEFLNHFNEYGRGTLKFSCEPKRWYKIGEKPIAVSSGSVLFNPSLVFKAKPLVQFTASGSVTITITDQDNTSKTFQTENLNGTYLIDSERHTAIKMADNSSINDKVLSQYENLSLGRKSTITYSYTVSNLIITPRWWTI